MNRVLLSAGGTVVGHNAITGVIALRAFCIHLDVVLRTQWANWTCPDDGCEHGKHRQNREYLFHVSPQSVKESEQWVCLCSILLFANLFLKDRAWQ